MYLAFIVSDIDRWDNRHRHDKGSCLVIPSFERQRQEDYKFKTSLSQNNKGTMLNQTLTALSVPLATC